MKILAFFVSVFVSIQGALAAEDCLGRITKFATEICGEINISGEQNLVDANGELKASISGIIKKIVGDAGASVNGKVLQDAYTNVLRKDLAAELFDVRKCRREMVEVGRQEACPKKAGKTDLSIIDNVLMAEYGRLGVASPCKFDAWARERCLGKVNCKFKVDNNLCGDPSPHHVKRIHLDFSCSKGGVQPRINANENEYAVLACPQ